MPREKRGSIFSTMGIIFAACTLPSVTAIKSNVYYLFLLDRKKSRTNMEVIGEIKRKSLNCTYLNEFTKSNLHTILRSEYLVVVYRIDNLSLTNLSKTSFLLIKPVFGEKSLTRCAPRRKWGKPCYKLSSLFPSLSHIRAHTHVRAHISLSPSSFITHLCCCWNFQSFV